MFPIQPYWGRRISSAMVARALTTGKQWPLAALLLIGLIAVALAPAAHGALSLEPGQSRPAIETSMSFAVDTGQSITALAAAYRDGQLYTDFADADSHAVAYQAVWAVTGLRNRRGQDGQGESAWIVVSNTYGTLQLQVLLLRGSGRIETLLDYDYKAPFSPEQFAVSRLRSRPIVLAPGETATLLLRVVNGPVRALSVDLSSKQDLAADSFDSGLSLAAFYAFSLSTLVVFFGFHISLRNGVGASYALLFAIGLAFLAYVDGFLFRFLYPDRPEWHLPVGLMILNAFSACGFLVAAAALRPELQRDSWRSRLPRIVMAMSILPVTTLFSYALLSADAVVTLTYLWVAVMLAVQVVAIGWWRDDPTHHRVVQAVAVLTLLVIVAMMAVYALGLWTPELSIPTLLKWIYAVTGLLFMAALTLSIVVLRREHRRALQDRVEILAQEAEQSRKLLETERAYSRARDQAALRQRQLATASHDIRQPLTSLRMSFDAMSAKLDPQLRDNLSDALDYLESLSGDYLADSRPAGSADDRADPPPPATAEPDNPPYPLSIILGAVRQMFSEEATSKQIRLRVVDSSLQTRVDTLALMRIVSNLVSNAVKYTDTGSVLVGVRRRSDGPAIQVIDSGRGMTPAEIEQFRAAYGKGQDSSGEGLGLAICTQLAERHGLRLDIRSRPGRGTRFDLSLPSLPRSQGPAVTP